jgi:hypothetical protein
MNARPRRWEIATTGFDEYLSLIGGDPDGQSTSVGLRVPTLATAVGAQSDRYLFNCASFTVADGECAVIRGYRQLVTIGYAQPLGETPSFGYRIVEQEVLSPFWRFPDGNISWHLRSIGPPNASQIPQPGPAGLTADGGVNAQSRSFAYNWSDAPALLFGVGQAAPPGGIYTQIGAYVAPNSGRVWGTGITAKQGTFYDLRTPWRTHGAWEALDIPVTGPDTIAFFASVRQTNPSTRPVLTLPGTFYSGGLSVEEQFLKNFPNAIYWRVGVALIVEEA